MLLTKRIHVCLQGLENFSENFAVLGNCKADLVAVDTVPSNPAL